MIMGRENQVTEEEYAALDELFQAECLNIALGPGGFHGRHVEHYTANGLIADGLITPVREYSQHDTMQLQPIDGFTLTKDGRRAYAQERERRRHAPK